MKVADGIEMLEITNEMNGGVSYIYPTLIWDEKEVVLIDTGFPGNLDKFREAFEKLGLSLSKITKIILTHHDIDHVGTLAPMVKELGDKVEVIAHEKEKPYITGELTPIKLAQLEANLDNLPEDKKGFYHMLKAGFAATLTDVNKTVIDGEVLPYCGGIQVIHTPGHTHGHIGLYHIPSKTLITGDSMNIQENHLVGANPVHTYDMKEANKSLQEYSKLNVQNIISYHCGLYQDNANAAMKELLVKM